MTAPAAVEVPVLEDEPAEAVEPGLDGPLSMLESEAVGSGNEVVDCMVFELTLAGPVGRDGGNVGAEVSTSPVDDVSAVLASGASGRYSR